MNVWWVPAHERCSYVFHLIDAAEYVIITWHSHCKISMVEEQRDVSWKPGAAWNLVTPCCSSIVKFCFPDTHCHTNWIDHIIACFNLFMRGHPCFSTTTADIPIASLDVWLRNSKVVCFNLNWFCFYDISYLFIWTALICDFPSSRCALSVATF